MQTIYLLELSGKDEKNTPAKKVLTPSRVFQEAKTLFRRSATPQKIVGRESERKTIEAFIQTHVVEGKPGALYISGCPGGGKTALVEQVLREYSESDLKAVKFVQLNCMSAKEPKLIFPAIYQKLTGRDDFLTSKEALEELDSLFVRRRANDKTM
jgi:cell division control protein 6